MEQNQQLLEQIQQKFLLKQMPAKEYSPLVLAYIGDGIYDMIVRTIFVSYGNTQVDKLNKQASNVCRASSQAAIAFAIAPLLTEEETSTAEVVMQDLLQKQRMQRCLIIVMQLD